MEQQGEVVLEGKPRDQEEEQARPEPEAPDKLIVWPPVIIMENAGLGRGPNGKLTGLDNAEVRLAIKPMIDESEYRRVMALYGPPGHLGAAFLVFPDTDVGYVKALEIHNAFKQRGRGRDDWKAHKPTVNEKKELFGYLANEEDMNYWDKKKKVIKRWGVESFRDKVLRPQKMRNEVWERAKILHQQKQQECAALVESTQAEKAKLEQRRRQLAELNAKIEAEKREGEEQKRRFEEQKAERRAKRKAELEQMLKGYKDREDKIRAELQKNKDTYRQEFVKIEEEINSVKSVIDKQKKENERRIKLAEYNSEHASQMRKEERLAQLEERKHKELMALKAAQQATLRRLKEQFNREKLAMYEEHRLKKQALDMKISNVEEEIQAQNCVICLERLEPPSQKMLYAACGHTSVCETCFSDVWKSSHDCPCCRKPQLTKPKPIPATVYL